MIAAATLAGAAAGVYLLSANVLTSESDPGTGAGPSVNPPSPTSIQTARVVSTGPSTRELADGCRDELTAGENLISAAQDGVDHWAAHVQARTDGLSGRITDEEMRAIWKETRLAGPDDVAAFTGAADRYEAVAGGCEEAAGVDASVVPAECVSMVALLAAAAESAHVVIGAWDGHLGNMRKFADGGMTADEAQSEWEQAWAKAPDDLQAHAASVQAVRDAPGCELSQT